MPGQHRRQPLAEVEHRLIVALKRRREAQGLSARGLSEKLGMHPATVGKIERAERAITFNELITLADALGIHPVRLLEEALDDASEGPSSA